MPGKDRERRLARERYERNLERRAEHRQRARKRNAVLGAVMGVVVVVGGASALAATLGFPASDQPTTASAPSPSSAQASATGSASGCSYDRVPKQQRTKYSTFVGTPSTSPKPDQEYKATLETNRGEIVIKLLNDKAPCTVNSFRFLASEGFYSETTCHRLVTTGIHVLQCGDPSGSGKGGPGYSFDDENLEGATYPRGTVAMANSGPDTNGSQFFIVYEKGGLAPKYTPFGKIVEGLDIVDKVAAAGVADDGVAPKKKVVIKDVSITKKS